MPQRLSANCAEPGQPIRTFLTCKYMWMFYSFLFSTSGIVCRSHSLRHPKILGDGAT